MKEKLTFAKTIFYMMIKSVLVTNVAKTSILPEYYTDYIREFYK